MSGENRDSMTDIQFPMRQGRFKSTLAGGETNEAVNGAQPGFPIPVLDFSANSPRLAGVVPHVASLMFSMQFFDEANDIGNTLSRASRVPRTTHKLPYLRQYRGCVHGNARFGGQ